MEALQTIYLAQISEALARLTACESMLSTYNLSKEPYILESATLQMRKALEAFAYAAIAPNKSQYVAYRAQADKNPDFRKDFNARAILNFLAEINPDFYPVPVTAPIALSPGTWHFDRRNDNSLSKKKFEKFYDRLGKHLHADNPWGNSKNQNNLAKDIPEIIAATRKLLSWHFTSIRTPEYSGVWIIKAPSDGTQPKIVVGQANCDFVVN